MEDNAPTIEIAFFGNMGQELTGIPVLQLAAISEGNNISVPSEITRLYNKKYTLAISVPFSSIQRENISYQVKNIIATAGPIITTETIYPATSGTKKELLHYPCKTSRLHILTASCIALSYMGTGQQTASTQDTTKGLPLPLPDTTKSDTDKVK